MFLYVLSHQAQSTPTETPSINPTRFPTFSPYPTDNPTPQSYLTCRTRKVNRRKKRCIRTPGCRWVRGVHWKQRCQPITPAPTSMPSRNPSHSMPSSSPSAPVIDIVHVFSRADLVVTCPFNKTEVEELIISDLIAALKQDVLSIEITTTILSDVSCTVVGRLLETLNTAALIEFIVVIHDELTSYNPIMLQDAAVTNIKSSVYDEFIESPSLAPSASPSSSPTWKPSAFPTSEVPSLRPTENPTSQSFLACRERKVDRRRRRCIRTPGCRWVQGMHWAQCCQPILAN